MLANVNGYIKPITVTGGGQDADGNNLPVTGTVLNSVDCYFNTNRYNHAGTYDGGKFTIASFYIFIDGAAKVDYGRLQLYDLNSKSYGEFEIQDVQYLSVVGCTKITIGNKNVSNS